MGQINHAAVLLELDNMQPDLIKEAMAEVRKGGKLDVVVQPSPSSVLEAERITRELYAYAPPNPVHLDFTVLFDAETDRDQWEKVFEGNSTSQKPSNTNTRSHQPSSEKSDFLGKYGTVAVGGTWDHMHWGHRLMLTMAAYTARTQLVVGVTASELLVNKKHAEALDSYDKRVRQSESFVKYLRPDLKVRSYPLHEMYGPTITIESIEALVVSAETSAGGKQINAKRAEMGWPEMDIIEVGLIPGSADGKLSSTDLRREELQNRSPSSKY